MKVWLCLSAGLLVLGLYSCAPTKKIVGERTLLMDEVVRRVFERNGKIKTLKGDGTITVESLEGSNSGSFDVRLKKPDSLKVEFSGPFGIHFGTLALSPDRFVFYNWIENRAVAGKPDGSTLESIFRLKMRFEEILNAFTGEFPAAARNDTINRFYVEDGLYVISYRTEEGTKEYRIDGDTFVITSYRILDGGGKSILNAFATELEDAGEIAMPRLVRVIFPKERRSVTIAYDDIELNKPVECMFTLPKQAEVIYR